MTENMLLKSLLLRLPWQANNEDCVSTREDPGLIPSGRTKIPQAVWRRKRRRGELRGWERKDGKDGGVERGGEENRRDKRRGRERKEGRKENKIKGCFF